MPNRLSQHSKRRPWTEVQRRPRVTDSPIHLVVGADAARHGVSAERLRHGGREAVARHGPHASEVRRRVVRAAFTAVANLGVVRVVVGKRHRLDHGVRQTHVIRERHLVAARRHRHARRRTGADVSPRQVVDAVHGVPDVEVRIGQDDVSRARADERTRKLALAGRTRTAVRAGVSRAVAVAVDVDPGLRRAGVGLGVAVVAVITARDEPVARRGARSATRSPVTVVVVVLVVGDGVARFVDLPVAVVVHAVAGLGRAGLDRSVRVVAVTALDGVVARLGTGVRDEPVHAVAVAVHVQVPDDDASRTIIHDTVAVVVDAVADLGLAGRPREVVVVAIGARRDVPRGLGARRGGAVHRTADRIAVLVREVHAARALVHDVVAVVVDGVADLGLAGRPREVVVVAVVVARGEPLGLGARRDGTVHATAGRVTVHIRVPGAGARCAVVHQVVAVVVLAVAGFRRAGVDRDVVVLAITGLNRVVRRLHARHHGLRGDPVVVLVGVPVPRRAPRRTVVHEVVAVVVDAVAGLGRVRVIEVARVIAVRVARHEAGTLNRARAARRFAVPVAIEVPVEGSVLQRAVDVVAVLIDAIDRRVWGAGVDERVAVVAVADGGREEREARGTERHAVFPTERVLVEVVDLDRTVTAQASFFGPVERVEAARHGAVAGVFLQAHAGRATRSHEHQAHECKQLNLHHVLLGENSPIDVSHFHCLELSPR